jgi:hypothetical protein
MKYQGEFKDMAAFFESKMGESYYKYDSERGYLLELGDVYEDENEYWGELEKIFKETGISMYLSKGNISIGFPINKSVRDKGFSSYLSYSDYNGPIIKGSNKVTRVAPCWKYSYTNGAGGGKQEK